jgi:hypothetical protein
MTTGWTTWLSMFDLRQRQKDFSSSLCVQTSPVAHPTSCPMGTGVPFPGSKERPERDADHSLPSSAEVISSRPCASMGCSGTALPFYVNLK